MQRFITCVLCIFALGALSACGGGGGGGVTGLPPALTMSEYASAYSSYAGDPNIASFTPQGTLDGMGGTATYQGYGGFTVGDGSGAAGYYGGFAMKADFGSNTFSGNGGNFVKFYSAVASPSVGNKVSGSVAFSGDLTAANESLGDGLDGTGSGTIEGQSFAFDVTGNITGLSGQGAVLYFHSTSGADAVGTAFILD